MKVLSLEQKALKRRQHNKEILSRMKKGEALTSFNSHTSWFPPRPIVKKDQADMQKLYGVQASGDALLSPKEENSNLFLLRS